MWEFTWLDSSPFWLQSENKEWQIQQQDHKIYFWFWLELLSILLRVLGLPGLPTLRGVLALKTYECGSKPSEMPPLRKERGDDTEELLDLSDGSPQEPHTTVRLRRLYSLSPQVLWATCWGRHTHTQNCFTVKQHNFTRPTFFWLLRVWGRRTFDLHY